MTRLRPFFLTSGDHSIEPGDSLVVQGWVGEDATPRRLTAPPPVAEAFTVVEYVIGQDSYFSHEQWRAGGMRLADVLALPLPPRLHAGRVLRWTVRNDGAAPLRFFALLTVELDADPRAAERD